MQIRAVKTTFLVRDMSNPQAEEQLRGALAGLAGVQSVTVDVRGKRVTITHAPQLGLVAMRNAIIAAGFKSAEKT